MTNAFQELPPPAITFAAVASALARTTPVTLAPAGYVASAVALILRETVAGTEMLFIERAKRDGDPWGGDLGFPGGKVDASDGTPRRAAERETWEELGLHLEEARFLGRLSDILGAHLPVKVSCFVYGARHVGPFQLSEEVQETFWIPVAALADPARHGEATVTFGDERLVRPAIRLPLEGKPMLWGITYRLVMQFLERLGCAPRLSG